jgi:Skp family chaperone for outer membrane proteins
MKKYASFIGVCFVAMIVAVGCDAGSPKGGVAVLDLDQVASAIGWDTELNAALKKRGESLDQRLIQKKARLEKLFEDNRSKMGENPTDEQKESLARFQLRANQQLQADLQASQQQMIQYRSGLVADLRDKLRPVAGELAEAKGLSLVVLKADPVFFVADTADITGEVIAKINEDATLKESLKISSEAENDGEASATEAAE